MAVVSFPARNKLAYPAGSPAGFDPNHIAARNCPFSGVATYGGTFCNLLTRSAGTEGGTKTTSIYGPLGAMTNYVAGTADSSVFPFTVSTTGLTLAAILKITAVSPGDSQYALNTAAAGATAIGDVFHAGTFTITNASSNNDTGVVWVADAPYFFAASLNGAVVNWVVVRLDTGSVRSASIADATAIAAGDGTITVGSRGNNARQINGGIAAAMANNSFMSESQLRKWGSDPWAFWYPPQARSLVAAATTPTTILYSLMNVG